MKVVQPTDDLDPILLQRPEINPYRYSLAEIWRRATWDLHRESRRSRRMMQSIRDSHCGKSAVILCNGPSLLKVNFDVIGKVFTFGLNKINLLFDKVAFRPSSIVAVNPLVIEQNAAFYNQTSIPLYLDSFATKFVKARTNVTFMHSTTNARFARDCSMSIYQGYTVTFVALQLAFHMGFRRVALVGCDHNFATKGPANSVAVAGARDESHFDPNYFAHGVKWHLPDLFQSEVSYEMARQVFAAAGREIVNCTEGGNLTVYPRRELGAFLAGC